MSEFSFDGFGGAPLRIGREMVALDPFTRNERWVPADSDEAKEYMQPSGPEFVVTEVDREAKTSTLSRKITTA